MLLSSALFSSQWLAKAVISLQRLFSVRQWETAASMFDHWLGSANRWNWSRQPISTEFTRLVHSIVSYHAFLFPLLFRASSSHFQTLLVFRTKLVVAKWYLSILSVVFVQCVHANKNICGRPGGKYDKS